MLFWWDVSGSFENVFGNKSLGDYAYILLGYAVNALDLTLESIRIFMLVHQVGSVIGDLCVCLCACVVVCLY